MEELVDVLDEEKGLKTGEIVSRLMAHKLGFWHETVHLMIFNKDKTKTLLQKRCSEKTLYPNLWDVAVGGHISSVETSLQSLGREVREELGLDAEKLDIQFYGRFKEDLSVNDVSCKWFVSIFVVYEDIDINDISLQKDEVSDVKWVDKSQLQQMYANGELLPHKYDYEILLSILK